MPISQDRMIKVLNAAAKWRDTSEMLRGAIRAYHKEMLEGQTPSTESLQRIYDLCIAGWPTNDEVECLVAEVAHFRSRRRRNDIEREAQRRRRARAEPDGAELSEAAMRLAYDQFNTQARDPGELPPLQPAELNQLADRAAAEAEAPPPKPLLPGQIISPSGKILDQGKLRAMRGTSEPPKPLALTERPPEAYSGDPAKKSIF